ncbi:MAG: hypothetical protein AB7P04_06735 [Bacteriovoracia bacterium]
MVAFFRFWVTLLLAALAVGVFSGAQASQLPAGNRLSPPFDYTGLSPACRSKLDLIQHTAAFFQDKCREWASASYQLACQKRGFQAIFNEENLLELATGVSGTLGGSATYQLACYQSLVATWGASKGTPAYQGKPLMNVPFSLAALDASCLQQLADVRVTVDYFSSKCESWAAGSISGNAACYAKGYDTVFKSEGLAEFAGPLCDTLRTTSGKNTCLADLIRTWGSRDLKMMLGPCLAVSNANDQLSCLKRAVENSN